MSGLNRLERNDLPAPASVKLASQIDTFLDGRKERAGAQASPNNEAADPIRDVNEIVDDFHFWRRFQENRCVEVSSRKHTAPLFAIRRFKGATSFVTSALTPVGKGKTPQNPIVIHRVPIRDDFSTNGSTNGCGLADIGGS